MLINCSRKTNFLTCQFLDDEKQRNMIATSVLDYLNTNTEDKMNFSSKMLDLLAISHFVFMIDKSISRDEGIDGWMRTFRVSIEVCDADFWNSKSIDLCKMLNYLSGDKWDIIFKSLEIEHYRYTNYFKDDEGTICMLSGGLDSLIGAIDLLESGKKDISFVSIKLGGSVNNNAQKEIITALESNYKHTESSFSRLSVHGSNNHGFIEKSTRTRSFVYFTVALAKHWQFKKTKIIIPENGFISLNVPITNSRLGSSTTRTTHQYYLNMLEKLYNDCDIHVSIENPYQLKTKGEMIDECLNRNLLLKLLPLSVSCAHPDVAVFKKRGLQCGYCWPCIIRRSALKHANINEETYYSMKLNDGVESRNSARAYKKLLIDFDKGNYATAVLQNGPIIKDLKDFIDLYKRGIIEIKNLLDNIL